MKSSLCVMFSLSFFVGSFSFESQAMNSNSSTNSNPSPAEYLEGLSKYFKALEDRNRELEKSQEEFNDFKTSYKRSQEEVQSLKKSHEESKEKFKSLEEQIYNLKQELRQDQGLWILTPPLRGLPGKQGEKGEPGQNGVGGRKGEAGEKGGVGVSGPRGEKGVPGPRGEKGVAGPIGPKGEKGSSGPNGVMGTVGSYRLDFPSPCNISSRHWAMSTKQFISYPSSGEYEHNLDVCYLITPPRGGRILVSVTKVQTETNYDYLEIKNRNNGAFTSVEKLTGALGSSLQKTYTSSTDEPLLLHFHTDHSGTNTGIYFSFEAQ